MTTRFCNLLTKRHCGIPIITLFILAATGCVNILLASESTAVPASPPVQAQTVTPDYWGDAQKALYAGDNQTAYTDAKLLLETTTDHKAWYYGNVVHEANQIMGLAVLNEGHVQEADQYLLAAGRTPGSPQIDSFGPNMMLAQQLLNHGQSQTVIEYLRLVAVFWAHDSEADLQRLEKFKPGLSAQVIAMDKQHQAQINTWIKQIQSGQKPTLNNSGSLWF